ncbi:Dynein regulatory complex protein 10 [Eumeta japonica]|uniref:Dynein regulatory complex protein 10 n=1 Tax=Eumeta variegata TaxID=151549 RepID=A0A4C1W8L7_EUMVA|nr:Dynein regulatory complex protein 10 [Eumeta japonica]
METSSGMFQSATSTRTSSTTGSTKSVRSASSEDRKSVGSGTGSGMSPIDMECKIQAERITKILDETVYKTKLAICIPYLVREYSILSKILTDEDVENLLYIFDLYDNPMTCASLMDATVLEEIKEGNLSFKNRLNPDLGQMIYILNSYPALKPRIEERIDQMRMECEEIEKDTPTAEEQNTLTAIDYLRNLELFRELMVVKVNKTAEQELSEKFNARKLEVSNAKLTTQIQEYQTKLREENEQFQAIMKQKEKTIEQMKQELALLEQNAAASLRKKIIESEREMVLESRTHAIKVELLQEEEAEAKEAHENMLRRNLLEEKNLRTRRCKVETQLLSWLQKYDLEMGDKQLEVDEYTEKYEEQLRIFEELQAKLVEQDLEYIPLMEERDNEYHQEMTAKMNKFMLEHAARVIQHAWREVLANRAEKKRLRRLIREKKRRKAEEAALAKKKLRMAAAEAAANQN